MNAMEEMVNKEIWQFLVVSGFCYLGQTKLFSSLLTLSKNKPYCCMWDKPLSYKLLPIALSRFLRTYQPGAK